MKCPMALHLIALIAILALTTTEQANVFKHTTSKSRERGMVARSPLLETTSSTLLVKRSPLDLRSRVLV